MTQPKPTYLGQAFGDQFADFAVVEAYDLRPPYPVDVFDILSRRVDVDAPVVLDVGCGTGEIARAMVGRGFRVDAVDPSAGMIAKGRSLPGGDAAGLTWIEGMAETAPLGDAYGLIVAGASLHWMEWDVVLPRFGRALSAAGVLALVDQRQGGLPWDDDAREICGRFSTNRGWRPYRMTDELETRGLFVLADAMETAPVPFVQCVNDYVESFHARNGFSRDRMRPEDAAAFDAEMTNLVRRYVGDDKVELSVVGTVSWGHPVSRGTA